jgi:hypothetical protein
VSTRLNAAGWILAAYVACGLPCSAVETRTWTADAAELLQGQADGIAVSARGRLSLAPRIQRMDDAMGGAAAVETWSACLGSDGKIFFGTGPDGIVFRTDGNGRGEEYFRTGETMVTALVQLGAGDLLAATSPGGRIYRIDPRGNGELWAETGERYVWAIVETDGGNVFAATGERGKILRIRPDGSAETHFDSDEPHIVSLLHRGAGALIAGGGGIGRVYEIDIDGNAMVLYDDELDEARSIARSGTNDWVVGLIGAPPQNIGRPELRLRLPDGVTVEPNVPLEENRGPTLRGFIEGLEQDAGAPRGLRGRLVRLQEDGRSSTLWQSADETPLSLTTDALGRVLMGTGQPARLYRVESDDDVSLLSTLSEAHATVLIRNDRTVFAGTSNPATVWRVEAIDAEQGAYLSPAHDAGTLARWGTISWSPHNRLARTEVYTRTGNSPRPDATWSAWSPAQVLADGSPVDNPDGRFAQFRVRFIGSQERGAGLGGVTLFYETYNRAPSLEPGTSNQIRAVGQTAQFEWKARDPDGDSLAALLEYRATLSDEWKTQPSDGTIPSGSTRFPAVQSGTVEWKTAELPEGLYDVRLSVSDQANNHPTAGLSARGPVRRIVVDRSPPSIEVRRLPDGRFEVVLSDDASPVRRLTLLRDGRSAARIRSTDGVCDSRRERFEFAAPASGPVWKIRGEDLAGNSVETELAAE